MGGSGLWLTCTWCGELLCPSEGQLGRRGSASSHAYTFPELALSLSDVRGNHGSVSCTLLPLEICCEIVTTRAGGVDLESSRQLPRNSDNQKPTFLYQKLRA